MNKILIAVFPSEVRAQAGFRALEDLDRDGAITLYAAAVIATDEESRVSVETPADASPLGAAVALVTGSLLGPLAGPVGLAVAAGVGTLGRVLYDLARLGVEEDFIIEVGDRLRPGTSAVVAEVWEDRITPVDARLQALGGTTFRRERKEIVDGRIEREVAALRAELASLRTELESATPGDRPHLEERVGAARASLRDARQRAQAVLDAMAKESGAKIELLQARAATAQGDAKARLEERIAEIRSQSRRRDEKVRHSWDLASRALA